MEQAPCPFRVLVVEDNMVNQKLTKVLLEKRGHLPTIAESGEQALVRLSEMDFDVVLMDVQMPGMDGYQTTIKIRQNEEKAGGRAPIVAMTAHAMQGDRERCLQTGMDGYLSKPFKPEDLYRTVEQYAASARAPQTEQPRELPMVSREELLKKFGEDPAMLNAMVDIFGQESPKQLQRVKEAMDNGDPTALRAAAHTLKGSVSIFTVGDLFEICYALENMGKNNELSEAPAMVEKASALVVRLNRELKALL